MSANKLRQAAQVLRSRAGSATPGRWHDDAPDRWEPEQMLNDPGVYSGETFVALTAYDNLSSTTANSGNDARYIATVDPLVGLALADWLDDHAANLDVAELFAKTPMVRTPALAVADAVLGDGRAAGVGA